MSLRFSLFVALGSCIILPVATSPAAVVFSFSTDQPTYNIAPGGTATVNVFLNETDGLGDTDVLTSQGGLIGYDLSLSVNSGSGLIVDANTTPSPPSFSSVFDSQSSPAKISSPGVAQVDLVLLSGDDPGPSGTAVGNSRTVLLSSFHVTGGSVVGSQTSFKLQDSTYYGTNTFTDAGTPLDLLIQAGAFNVDVVAPEPTALAILCPLGCILVRRHRAAGFAPQE